MKKKLEVRIRLKISILLFLAILLGTSSKVEAQHSQTKSISKSDATVVEKNVAHINNLKFSFNNEARKSKEKSYTDEDVYLLAHLMYAEVGVFIQTLPINEAKEAHMLTGSAVIYRVQTNYRGATTLKEAIYAKGQYQCVANGAINKEPPTIVYEWATELLENGPIGAENMIFQSQYKQGTSVYKKIGNQYFCCQ